MSGFFMNLWTIIHGFMIGLYFSLNDLMNAPIVSLFTQSLLTIIQRSLSLIHSTPKRILT